MLSKKAYWEVLPEFSSASTVGGFAITSVKVRTPPLLKVEVNVDVT